MPQYDQCVSPAKVNSFISWYEAKQAGSGTASYAIDKHVNNKGPFSSRKDFIIFNRILTFEVSEYSSR
ncbi:galactose oxidase [Paenibacillus sp. 23TSA30-6]|nr:galactose oxidase [Paenibacillus sp. 23TSA30-6]